MQLMVQQTLDTKSTSSPRFTPSNPCAILLAEMMDVDFFTLTKLRTWIKMGGTVMIDGKEWKP